MAKHYPLVSSSAPRRRLSLAYQPFDVTPPSTPALFSISSFLPSHRQVQRLRDASNRGE
jgi:hypothetical protein